MKSTKHPKTAWKGSSVETSKPWGSVISWSAINSIGGKIIKINKNERTSQKYNTLKDEVLFLISGRVIVSTWPSKRTPGHLPEIRTPLTPGDTFNIQSEVPFRIQALDDSYIVEISNGINNDVVMFDDDYGRVDEES